MLHPKLFEPNPTFYTMWSNKPYQLPLDCFQAFNSDSFFQLLENRLNNLEIDKPTCPRILLETSTMVSLLNELHLEGTPDATRRRCRWLIDFLLRHPSSPSHHSFRNKQYIQTIQTVVEKWFRIDPLFAALTFRDAIVDFKYHDNMHILRCAHTVEDHSFINNFLASVFEDGMSSLAEFNNTSSQLSPQEYLLPIMDSLLPDTHPYVDAHPPLHVAPFSVYASCNLRAKRSELS